MPAQNSETDAGCAREGVVHSMLEQVMRTNCGGVVTVVAKLMLVSCSDTDQITGLLFYGGEADTGCLKCVVIYLECIGHCSTVVLIKLSKLNR